MKTMNNNKIIHALARRAEQSEVVALAIAVAMMAVLIPLAVSTLWVLCRLTSH